MQRLSFPWLLAILSATTLFAGCMSFPPFPDRNRPSIAEVAEDPSLMNGERIYFTGTNIDGERIRYTGGPDFGGMMMGSFLTCASCHGVDARGGRHFMHMQVMDAPDIRIAALSAEAHHEEEREKPADQEHDEGEKTFAYTLEDFRRAVVEGRHPSGEPLDPNMPRWQLSDRDLQDLYNFLASFPYP